MALAVSKCQPILLSSMHTYMYLKVFLKWKHCIALLMNSELVPSFAPDLEINQSFIHFLHKGLLGWFFYFDWTLRNIWYFISDNFTKVTLAHINYIHSYLFQNLNSELTFLLWGHSTTTWTEFGHFLTPPGPPAWAVFLPWAWTKTDIFWPPPLLILST